MASTPTRQYLHQLAHPEQGKVKPVLYATLKAGRLIKPSFCTACLAEDRPIEAHHPDYRFPLMVLWLCHSCHQLVHTNALSPDRIEQSRSYLELKRTGALAPNQQRHARKCAFCHGPQPHNRITLVEQRHDLWNNTEHTSQRRHSRTYCDKCDPRANRWAVNFPRNLNTYFGTRGQRPSNFQVVKVPLPIPSHAVTALPTT